MKTLIHEIERTREKQSNIVAEVQFSKASELLAAVLHRRLTPPRHAMQLRTEV